MSEVTETARSQAGERPGTRPSRRADVAVVAAAVVLAGTAWGLVTGPLDVVLAAPVGGETTEVSLAAAMVCAAMAGTCGMLLLWGMEARMRRGLAVWTGLAAVVLLLSLAGPASAETSGAVAGLAALHVVVGAVVVLGLRAVRRA